MDNSQDLNIIFKKLKKDDLVAFEKIYLEFHQPLSVFLLSYTNDKNLIEDIVHDVFMSLWNKRKSIKINSSIKSYLFRSCYNKFIDDQRDNAKKIEMLSSYYYTALMQATNIDKEKKDDNLKKLDNCIESLPEKCKVVFKENKLNGKKYDQISDEFKISKKTVEGHITKAYKLIKNCFKLKG